jgi:hypothetical protein
MSPNPLVEKLARLFHTYYERLAPECGYARGREAAVPWEDVPEPNKQLVRETVSAVLDHIFREADFRNGEEVEVVVPIPGVDRPFAEKGERGKLLIRDMDFQLILPNERWWTTIERYEVAIHLKSVRAGEPTKLTEPEMQAVGRLAEALAYLEREDIIGAILKTGAFHCLADHDHAVVNLAHKLSEALDRAKKASPVLASISEDES